MPHRSGNRPKIDDEGACCFGSSFASDYSPDLNPIELAWSKVKTILRSHAARSYEDLETAVVAALSAITCADIAGWFRHCGY